MANKNKNKNNNNNNNNSIRGLASADEETKKE